MRCIEKNERRNIIKTYSLKKVYLMELKIDWFNI